jgi:transketolase
VIAPCDPLEAIECTRWCAKQKEGPVYLRIGKAGEPVLTEKAIEPWTFGKVRYLQRGADVCLLAYGTIMSKVVELARAIEAQGKSVSIVSCHTVKPLDRAGIITALTSYKQVIVVEEHVPEGGLASRVKQIAWDVKPNCKLDTFTLKDEFIHNYGSHDDLLASHGLSVPRMLAAVA